jgi:hypothetical protein
MTLPIPLWANCNMVTALQYDGRSMSCRRNATHSSFIARLPLLKAHAVMRRVSCHSISGITLHIKTCGELDRYPEPGGTGPGPTLAAAAGYWSVPSLGHGRGQGGLGGRGMAPDSLYSVCLM